MLDMRFSGLPRFVTGFAVIDEISDNDDAAPMAPAAAASGNAAGRGRMSFHHRPLSTVPLFRKPRAHLIVVE